MNQGRAIRAGVVVTLDCPEQMRAPMANVLCGEYESGWSGEGLTVLDLGANVGAFTLWANMRWPGSTIHAYEPHPATFQMLARNTGTLRNVVLHEAAVFPGAETRQAFYARYPGDGLAGMAACASRTFTALERENTFAVDVVAPARLPACDIVKLDVEGAEADILDAMDLSRVSLVLLEYHNAESARRIRARLDADFACDHEDSSPWDPFLVDPRFRRALSNDRFGHLFFASRRANKLRKVDLADVRAAERTPLRKLLAALPGAAAHAVGKRLRRLGL
jgi:FkbM family methyltransferase